MEIVNGVLVKKTVIYCKYTPPSVKVAKWNIVCSLCSKCFIAVLFSQECEQQGN